MSDSQLAIQQLFDLIKLSFTQKGWFVGWFILLLLIYTYGRYLETK